MRTVAKMMDTRGTLGETGMIDRKGYTLVELLIVIVFFAIAALLIGGSIYLLMHLPEACVVIKVEG